MNTLAPGCTSLTVSPKCARIVPFRKKEDIVGLGMPVGVDFLSYWNACRKQDQMRGSSILRVDLENEGLSRIGMPRPSPHHAALAFVFLKESAESAWLRRLLAGFGARGRGGAGTAEDRKNTVDW
jgi:hypothetical protein